MFSREGYQSQILASLTAFSICSRKAVRLARLVDWDSSIIGNCRQQAGYIVSGHRVRSARQVRDGRCGGRCSGTWLVKTLGRKNCQDPRNGWLPVTAQREMIGSLIRKVT